MTARHSEAEPPLVDLQQLVAGIRFRRWLLVGTPFLGLLAGALLTLAAPPTPTAVVRLMVVHENGMSADGGRMETNVALVETRPIAAEALRRINGRVSPRALLNSYEATGLTNNVMQITVSGPSERRALARAEAIARTFIADHIRRITEMVNARTQALRQRMRRLRSTIQRDGTETASSETLARLNELARRAEEIRMIIPRVRAGTEIVDGPRPITESVLAVGARNVLMGTVLGLGSGIGLAGMATVLRDRPVLRRDIATHLGASVVAQLPSSGGRRRWWIPHGRKAAEYERLATTLARLVARHPCDVSLLGLGCPGHVARLSVEVARVLARERQVSLVDDLPDREATKLVRGSGEPVEIRDGAQYPRPPEESGVRRLGVGSAEPGVAFTDATSLGARTLLVVRPGRSSTAWLHAVARQLAESDTAVLGVVLVHPDPRDRSDGMLFDGLHTALRAGIEPCGGNGVRAPRSTEYHSADGSAAQHRQEV